MLSLKFFLYIEKQKIRDVDSDSTNIHNIQSSVSFFISSCSDSLFQSCIVPLKL